MTKIKAVGFDYGGVIAVYKTVIPQIAEICGLAPEELRGEYHRHNHMANVGDLSYPEVWKLVIEKLNHGDKYPQILNCLAAYDRPDLDSRMLELVAKLKQRGYKVGLLTNNTRANGQKLRNIGLDKHFDAFFVSAEIGHQKPDKEAFLTLFNALGVAPQQAIYIDDSPNSLKFAEEIGYRPLLFTDYEQLIQELTALEVLDQGPK